MSIDKMEVYKEGKYIPYDSTEEVEKGEQVVCINGLWYSLSELAAHYTYDTSCGKKVEE